MLLHSKKIIMICPPPYFSQECIKNFKKKWFLIERLQMKNIANHAVGFLHVKLPIVRYDSRCILSAMLQHRQSVIEVLNNILGAYNTKNSTHGMKSTVGMVKNKNKQ